MIQRSARANLLVAFAILAALLISAQALGLPSKLLAASIGTGSCTTGTTPCDGNTGNIGDNSCNGNSACFNNTGNIGDNSCNGAFACDGNTGTVGDNSCTGDDACDANGGTVGDGSCQGTDACDANTGTVGDNSCHGQDSVTPTAGLLVITLAMVKTANATVMAVLSATTLARRRAATSAMATPPTPLATDSCDNEQGTCDVTGEDIGDCVFNDVTPPACNAGSVAHIHAHDYAHA